MIRFVFEFMSCAVDSIGVDFFTSGLCCWDDRLGKFLFKNAAPLCLEEIWLSKIELLLGMLSEGCTALGVGSSFILGD